MISALQKLKQFSFFLRIVVQSVAILAIGQLLFSFGSNRIKIIQPIKQKEEFTQWLNLLDSEYVFLLLLIGLLFLLVSLFLNIHQLVTGESYRPSFFHRLISFVSSLFSIGGYLGVWTLYKKNLESSPSSSEILLRIGPCRVVDCKLLEQKKENLFQQFTTFYHQKIMQEKKISLVDHIDLQDKLQKLIQIRKKEITDWEFTSFSIEQLFKENKVYIEALVEDKLLFLEGSQTYFQSLIGWMAEYPGHTGIGIGVILGSALWILVSYLRSKEQERLDLLKEEFSNQLIDEMLKQQRQVELLNQMASQLEQKIVEKSATELNKMLQQILKQQESLDEINNKIIHFTTNQQESTSRATELIENIKKQQTESIEQLNQTKETIIKLQEQTKENSVNILAHRKMIDHDESELMKTFENIKIRFETNEQLLDKTRRILANTSTSGNYLHNLAEGKTQVLYAMLRGTGLFGNNLPETFDVLFPRNNDLDFWNNDDRLYGIYKTQREQQNRLKYHMPKRPITCLYPYPFNQANIPRVPPHNPAVAAAIAGLHNPVVTIPTPTPPPPATPAPAPDWLSAAERRAKGKRER